MTPYREFVGKSVRVTCKNGPELEGRLHSVIKRSAWLLQSDGDLFLKMDEIVAMTLLD